MRSVITALAGGCAALCLFAGCLLDGDDAGSDGAKPKDGDASADACAVPDSAVTPSSCTLADVAVETQPGTWRTEVDKTSCRYHLVGPDGNKARLRGVSTTGLETGTRETASGAGFWLFQAASGSQATNAPAILKNVVSTLVTDWKTKLVRIPICSSAWLQDYQVHDFGPNGGSPIAKYQQWVDTAIQEARSKGSVVIIDNHLWAIGKMGNGTNVDRGTFTSNGATHRYAEFEDGCTGTNKVGTTDSCAAQDFTAADANTWECPIANADGVSLHNAYYNRDKIAAVWRDIATKYKADDGVWFEVYNEPYARKTNTPFPANGENLSDSELPWDLWSAFMLEQIQAIRDGAGAGNMIIVNGLDFGYDFGPDYGPIAHPDKYLPWASRYPNVAYGFHPYQLGACCGAVGAGADDESAADPYESGFCSFYPDGTTWGKPSGAPLPSGTTCANAGYSPSMDNKMPPCTWVPTARNPKTGALGLCAGDRTICPSKSQAECEATDDSAPSAGGWSKHVLPMAKYGPLLATEFGSFDCSSPYVRRLLAYMDKFDISYTAWSLWPQNSGGPAGLGACGYPSVMTPTAAPGDLRACLDPAQCQSLMQPLPWSGKLTYGDLTSH